jgi:hypothetical protein
MTSVLLPAIQLRVWRFGAAANLALRTDRPP